ncbi:MAG: Lrp/AsnC ligand binding domain-containing protein [Candidatus Methylarchaceae archaeon HK01M]|nr:Lrp/AsnC ligand binding domain-containing protein [Candidatus Methylarchaceae archaeon HK01M]
MFLILISMPIAFVLMSVESGSDRAIMKKLKDMVVEEAYEIYGAYDIIAKIKAESVDRLKEIVMKIRKIKDVRTTLTLLVV